jgi:hypothetical protein
MKPRITHQEFESNIQSKLVLAFAQTASPKLLHQMAMQWNWDHMDPFINWLVKRPETDLATVTMIYWMSGPRWWKQYRDKEDLLASGDLTAGFNFTEELERKILAGFYKNQQFAFDPTVADEGGIVWAEEYTDRTTVREIPPALLWALKGEHVEWAKGFEEGMPPELVAKIQEAYDSYEII